MCSVRTRRKLVAGARFDTCLLVGAEVGQLYGAPREKLDNELALVRYVLDFVNRDTDLVRSELMEEAGVERRSFLAGVLADRQKAAARFLEDAAKPMQRVWLLPDPRPTSRGVQFRPHVIMLDLKAFDAFVSTLFLDESRTFGGDLCQCKLPACARFFLVRRSAPGEKGRWQRSYCPGTGHSDVAHNAGSTRRQKDHRARKAAAAILVERGYPRVGQRFGQASIRETPRRNAREASPPGYACRATDPPPGV
jgi:hypothetical protein